MIKARKKNFRAREWYAGKHERQYRLTGKKLKAKRYVIPIEGDEKLFESLVNNLNR